MCVMWKESCVLLTCLFPNFESRMPNVECRSSPRIGPGLESPDENACVPPPVSMCVVALRAFYQRHYLTFRVFARATSLSLSRLKIMLTMVREGTKQKRMCININCGANMIFFSYFYSCNCFGAVFTLSKRRIGVALGASLFC